MFGYSSSIDWSQFSTEERALLEDLPHGSGIDCDWHIEKAKSGKIVAHNSYHCMDDMGGYCGYADFSIRWTPGQEKDFRLMFHGREAQYLNTKYMLRDYLEDTFYHALTTAV